MRIIWMSVVLLLSIHQGMTTTQMQNPTSGNIKKGGIQNQKKFVVLEKRRESNFPSLPAFQNETNVIAMNNPNFEAAKPFKQIKESPESQQPFSPNHQSLREKRRGLKGKAINLWNTTANSVILLKQTKSLDRKTKPLRKPAIHQFMTTNQVGKPINKKLKNKRVSRIKRRPPVSALMWALLTILRYKYNQSAAWNTILNAANELKHQKETKFSTNPQIGNHLNIIPWEQIDGKNQMELKMLLVNMLLNVTNVADAWDEIIQAGTASNHMKENLEEKPDSLPAFRLVRQFPTTIQTNESKSVLNNGTSKTVARPTKEANPPKQRNESLEKRSIIQLASSPSTTPFLTTNEELSKTDPEYPQPTQGIFLTTSLHKVHYSSTPDQKTSPDTKVKSSQDPQDQLSEKQMPSNHQENNDKQKLDNNTDYCSLGKNHTMCLYQPSGCKNLTIVKNRLSSHDIDVVLYMHNSLRSYVSRGKVDGLPPAVPPLVELKWDPELAAIAQRWVDQCSLGTDVNRRTERFENVHQIMTWSKQNSSLTQNPWNGLSKAWHDGIYKFTKTYGGDIRQFDEYRVKPDKHEALMASFTQVVWADTLYVGCGYLIAKDEFYHHVFEACNYAPGGNIPGKPVYGT